MFDVEKEIFNIISYGGDAKAIAYEALELAHAYEFSEAEKKLEKANQTLVTAHNTQTKLISAEINGEKVPMSLLMVHAQDHLMAALTEISLIEQMMKMLKKLYRLEKEI